MRTAGSTLASASCCPSDGELGELAGGVPVQRTLPGERLGEVAEHRDVGERVVPPSGVVLVGHGPKPTAAPGGSVRAVDHVDRSVWVSDASSALGVARRRAAATSWSTLVRPRRRVRRARVAHRGRRRRPRPPPRERHRGDHARRSPSATAARHVVLVSSAMVYGAWANNPVPLTEDARAAPRRRVRLRPPARRRRAARRRVASGRARPHGHGAAPGVGDGRRRHRADGRRARRRHGPACRRGRSAGAVPAPRRPHRGRGAGRRAASSTGCSTSPPTAGCAGERVRALAGEVPRLKLPERLAEVVARLRWRFQRGPIPPGPAQLHPLAVAGGQRPAEGRGLAGRRSPTSRPTSRAPRPSGGRWSRPSAARS